MKTDFVLSLDGDILTLSDSKVPFPSFEIRLLKGSRVTVRVTVDEPLTPEEQAEVIESFTTNVALPSGRLVFATRWDDEDDGDDEGSSRSISLPKGKYRFTLHTTIAGPCVPAKLEKESLASYFKRTRPGEKPPSWLDDDSETEDFWLGLIACLQADPDAEPVKTPAKPIRPGKDVRKPSVCPPGLLSQMPLGWEDYVQTDLHYVHKIPKLVAKLELQTIQGGPVSLPVKDLVLPYWIAWICGETHPWVKVVCPESFSPEWPGFKKGIKGTRVADGWEIDIEGMNARWSQFDHLRQVATILEDLPDGSIIELSCACDDGDGKKGRQRYLGPVSGGLWQISQTYPAISSELLAGMLDLVRQGETGSTVRAKDEKEADAIEKAIRTKDFLLRETPPTRKGTLFQLPQKDKHLMAFLVARAFAARYPKALPMIDRDDDLGDWDNLMDKIAEAGASFATGELVFEGRFAKFTKTNLKDLQFANHELIDSAHEWLEKSGFQLLGDLNSTQTFQAVFRGYGLPGAPVYAAVIANGFGSTAFDFYTRFPDGFSLTTSGADQETIKTQSSTDRKKKSYRSEVPGGIVKQWEVHLGTLSSLAEHHGTPEASAGLTEFASELDDFFCRQHGIA